MVNTILWWRHGLFCNTKVVRMLLSQQRNQVHKKWRELANKMWIRGLHLWFIALLSQLKPAMVASSVHSERLEVFQDFLCWRWGGHFCWNLQHQLKGGASIKTMWLDVGRYPHNWKCRVAFMSINEQMALCYRAGLFLLLLHQLLFHSPPPDWIWLPTIPKSSERSFLPRLKVPACDL